MVSRTHGPYVPTFGILTHPPTSIIASHGGTMSFVFRLVRDKRMVHFGSFIALDGSSQAQRHGFTFLSLENAMEGLIFCSSATKRDSSAGET